MKAMILAAGFGTRLRPLTDETPKPLLPVASRPLIHYVLLLLKKYGITDVFINVHYLGHKIIQEIGNGSRFGMNVTYSEEPEILGTGGGIKKIATALARETFLVINADILIDLNLDKVIEFHHRKKGAATLVLREDPDVERFGPIEIDGKDQVRNILGKFDWNGEVMRRLMFTGVHLLEPKVLDFIPPRSFYSITDAYIEMVRQNEKLFGYAMKGYWNDLGEIDRYRKVNDDLKDGAIRLSYLRSGKNDQADPPASSSTWKTP